MFIKLIGYKLLINVRQKETFFWCIAFPFILAFLFSSCFGSLYDLNTQENVISIGIVEDENSDGIVREALESTDFFSVELFDKDTAEKEKSEGKIDAILTIENNEATISANENDTTTNIIKSVVDTISQTKSAITHIYSINPQGVSEEIYGDMSLSYTDTHNSSENNDPYAIFFFALIAMACLFTANIGLYTVNSIQANLSSIGTRQCIAPRGKSYIFGAYLIADFITQVVSVTALLYFIKYILDYNIGTISIRMLLFCYTSIFASLTLGTLISAAFKISENVKNGIISAVALISCGMAGLYSPNIKIILEEKAPFISYINPATLMSDGLLSLYYLDSMSLYNRCILTLLGAGIVLYAVTFLILRRQKYASI